MMVGMERVLETLRFAVFDFELEPRETIVFPAFKGNAFRGALGNALRQLTCALQAGDCGGCIVRHRCVYAQIFESHNTGNASILKNIEKAPHPFIIYIPDKYNLEYPPDKPFHLTLTLVGSALDALAYFILAFEYIGSRGIGRDRGRFGVKRVSTGDTDIYDPVEKKVTRHYPVFKGTDFIQSGDAADRSHLKITLDTPLRLRSDNRLQKHISFDMLIRSLLRRLHILSALYCGGPEKVDFRGLLQIAATIQTTNSSISWNQQTRFSHRQERTISMGGVTGHLEFAGPIAPFLPYLRLAQSLHIGSGTSLGLGRLKM